MFTLFRTTCTTDYKCRPYHELVVVATSTERLPLLAAMNADVRKWQKADIDAENQERKVEADVGGVEFVPLEKWEQEGVRFEMDKTREEGMRGFVHCSSDCRGTIVYHILDMSSPQLTVR